VQVDTGLIDSVLIGFSRAGEKARAEATSSESRRAVLEAILALDGAIGRATADNAFAPLRDTLDLDRLLALSSSSERDAALATVKATLNAFTRSTATTSLATLVLADIALGQGGNASPLAYASAGTTASTLKLFA
jgi:hypothetical protein